MLPPGTLKFVNSRLEYYGMPSSSISTTHGGRWLMLTGIPVSQANELLGALYQPYQHAGTNDTIILRTIGYALPTVLRTRTECRTDNVLRLHAHVAEDTTRSFRWSNSSASEGVAESS